MQERDIQKIFENNLGDLSEKAKEIRERKEFKELSDERSIKEAIKHKSDFQKESEPEINEQKKISGSDFFPSYMNEDAIPDEVKLEVENLISLTFKEGLEAGLRESWKYPYFIQDAFHDALSVKVLPLMKEKGLI